MKHASEYINRRLQIEEESNISLVGHYMSEHNISQCVSLTRIKLWMVGIFFSMDHSYWKKTYTSALGVTSGTTKVQYIPGARKDRCGSSTG
ncbi:Holliday junction resolvase [Zea mays]|uniref:Holliday junction resolvase n=1 Tax=Zea mays TaxID=4577 RepID=A0A1D6K8K0_MAIZE|nr:Holliday junction resolvase [Zea mays]